MLPSGGLQRFFLALSIAAISVNSQQPQCDNAACYAGWKIKNHIDPTVSPCDDFYRHVCSKYIAANKEKSFYSEAAKLYDEEKLFLLNEPIRPDDEESAVKVKQHYQRCMDTQTRNANGLRKIKSVIDEFGGWPLLMTDAERSTYRKPWQDLHNDYVHKYGEESSLFDIKVNVYPKAHHYPTHLIYVDRSIGPFGIETPNAWDDSKKGSYLTYMTSVIKTFGLRQVLPAQIYYGLEDVFNFRTEILKLREEYRGNHIVPIATWQKEYDSNPARPDGVARIDWVSMIGASFKNVRNIVVDRNTEISVLGKAYLLKLIELLKNTSPAVIADHLHLYFLEKNLKYADDATVGGLQKLYSDFRTYDFDLSFGKERACYNFINMPHAVDRLFVRRRIPAGFLDNITQMFVNIKDELKKQIMDSQRVDSQAKSGLIRKVENITAELGFPNWYKNETIIAGFYQDIQVGSDFMENMLQIQRHNYVQKMALLSPNGKQEPDALLSVTNAYYSPAKNGIQLSLSILRPPFFHVLWPDVMKYAMAGFTIGHEISHGLDYTGYRVDELGNTGSWLSPADNSSFQRVADCYADQYLAAAKKVYPPTTINPYDFLPENIADGQGLRIAYGAFKAKGQRTTTVKYLENYSEDQIFFLAYGLAECHVEDRAALESKLSNPRDFHAFPSFRVNGPVSNMPEFSRAFGCNSAAPMNPTKKCNVWS